jgi:hypothetical protein
LVQLRKNYIYTGNRIKLWTSNSDTISQQKRIRKSDSFIHAQPNRSSASHQSWPQVIQTMMEKYFERSYLYWHRPKNLCKRNFESRNNKTKPKKMMARCPDYARSISVTNSTSQAIQVKAVHKNPAGSDAINTDTVTIEPGQKHDFAEQSVNMGTWTATASVEHIEINNNTHKKEHKPQVSGVVERVEVTVENDEEGGLSVRQ